MLAMFACAAAPSSRMETPLKPRSANIRSAVRRMRSRVPSSSLGSTTATVSAVPRFTSTSPLRPSGAGIDTPTEADLNTCLHRGRRCLQPGAATMMEERMSTGAKKTLVIRNGTLIDGSGQAATRNDAIVIDGNRIRSVGALPPDVTLEDRKNVEVIDAAGQWIMPGLIDAHCHMSYGYPLIKGEG